MTITKRNEKEEALYPMTAGNMLEQYEIEYDKKCCSSLIQGIQEILDDCADRGMRPDFVLKRWNWEYKCPVVYMRFPRLGGKPETWSVTFAGEQICMSGLRR